MADFTISISDTLYEKALRVAEANATTVEDVIRQHLMDAFESPPLELPIDERTELKALQYLSDDTLWTLLREQMPPARQMRLSALMEMNSRGTTSIEEAAELAGLVEDGDRLMLRKAEAMRLLLDRGYTVNLDDMTPTNGQSDLG